MLAASPAAPHRLALNHFQRLRLLINDARRRSRFRLPAPNTSRSFPVRACSSYRPRINVFPPLLQPVKTHQRDSIIPNPSVYIASRICVARSSQTPLPIPSPSFRSCIAKVTAAAVPTPPRSVLRAIAPNSFRSPSSRNPQRAAPPPLLPLHVAAHLMQPPSAPFASTPHSHSSRRSARNRSQTQMPPVVRTSDLRTADHVVRFRFHAIRAFLLRHRAPGVGSVIPHSPSSVRCTRSPRLSDTLRGSS